MTVKFAISTVNLLGTYTEKMDHYDPIEAVILSFDDTGDALHLIILDMMYMSFRRCTKIRNQLGKSLGIQAEQIILHFTHTHTGPSADDMDEQALQTVLHNAIEENSEKSEAVEMAYTEIDSQGRWSVNRRKQMPHDMGKMTVWAGFEESSEGRLDATRIIKRRLKDWFGEEFNHPDFDGPFYYDEDERDSILQQLVFKNLQGELVGSLVRFACHPPIAGHTSRRRYSADFPGYVRRLLNEQFGGEHAYLTGPCGNIAPWEFGDWKEIPRSDRVANQPPMGPFTEEDASFKEAQRIAKEIVQSLSDAWPQTDAFELLESMASDLVPFDLQLRDDLLTNPEDVETESVAILQRLTENKDLSFAEYKRLADRYTFLDYHKDFAERGYLDEETIKKGSIEINIPAIRLNRIILQGMPGESFWESAELAQQSVKEKEFEFISFSFANGSIAYLPTDDERPNGDYEVCYCIAGEGAVTKLSQQLEINSLHMIEESFETRDT
ncbi:MAG: hypothetical protein HRT89_09675 [Lentisphaeria bacterium]|nr:hypothetical protein [Lentisphaeria bacterium]